MLLHASTSSVVLAQPLLLCGRTSRGHDMGMVGLRQGPCSTLCKALADAVLQCLGALGRALAAGTLGLMQCRT